MYFYYFLGYQLEARDDLTREQKETRAMNTYCLALGNLPNYYYGICNHIFIIFLFKYTSKHLNF